MLAMLIYTDCLEIIFTLLLLHVEAFCMKSLGECLGLVVSRFGCSSVYW